MSHPSAAELLARHGFAAKRSWGQNFLTDERTFAAIVEASGAGTGDTVVEIGAGLGTLTARLAARGGRVVAIERERDMVAVLHAELAASANVEIVEHNALTFDYGAVAEAAGGPIVVVGNLPYQIASPLLFALLAHRRSIRRLVVMLQREMAERIVAAPGTAAYGALGVMIALYGEARLLRKVSRGAFLPAPRVDSAVLTVDLPPTLRAPVTDEARFSRVVHAAFGQRRKMLRNALTTVADSPVVEAALGAAAIDPTRRGETLSLAELARLAEAFPKAP